MKDLKQFTSRLDKASVRYGSWTGEEKRPTVQPDGVEQVYLQVPANFWVEVNNDAFQKTPSRVGAPGGSLQVLSGTPTRRLAYDQDSS